MTNEGHSCCFSIQMRIKCFKGPVAFRDQHILTTKNLEGGEEKEEGEEEEEEKLEQEEEEKETIMD